VTIRVSRFGAHLWKIGAPYYSAALRDCAKSVPGMRWEGVWVGYADAVDAVYRRLEARGANLQRGDLPTGPEKVETGSLLTSYKDLRDYQKIGVDFLLANGPTGALLADDMGLGKSAQALRAARAFRGKTLVVCVSYARDNWAGREEELGKKSEVEKWWPDGFKNSLILSGTKPSLIPVISQETQIVIIHYDILHAWVDALIAWGVRTIILDECQFCQSETSRRSKAARVIARTCAVRIGLSGTPMENRPRNLWNICDILSEGRFGENFFRYGVVFCNGHKEQITLDKVIWDFKGSSNEDELRHRLKFFMLRRTKVDVAAELPAMTRTIVNIDVGRKYQFQVTPVIAKSKKAMRRILNVAADGKLKEAVTLIRDYAEGRKVVVFTHRRRIAEYVVEAMTGYKVNASFIHGGVTQPKRLAIVKDAIRCKTDHVLAATINSMGTSIDLSYASVCVFLELTWEPSKLAQAESRLHRFGQKLPVLTVYIIARGTADELILHKVISKLGLQSDLGMGLSNGLQEDLDDAPKGQDALDELARAVEEQEAERARLAAKYQSRPKKKRVA
jgi:SNF2 family DNA or RNA helicase